MKHDSHIVETYYTSPVFSNHSHLQQLNLIVIPPSLTHSHWFNLFQTICNSVEIGSTK